MGDRKIMTLAEMKRLNSKIRRINKKIERTRNFYTGKENNSLDRLDLSLQQLYKEDRLDFKELTDRNVDGRYLRMLNNALDKVDNSPYFTEKGRRELRNRIYDSFMIGEYSFDITKTSFFKIMENDLFQKAIEAISGDSPTGIKVAETLYKESGGSYAKVNKMLKQYVAYNNDKDLRDMKIIEWLDTYSYEKRKKGQYKEVDKRRHKQGIGRTEL